MLTCHQIWESLGLDVTSIETRPSDHRAASWILSLDYSEQTVSPEKVKLHKLSPGLPYHDTKPPPGVHVIKVEAFRVKIILEKPHIATPSPSGLRKIDDVTHEHENSPFDGESLFNNHGTAEEEHLGLDNDEEFWHSGSVQCSTAPHEIYERQDCDKTATDGSYAYLTPPASQEEKESSNSDRVLNSFQHMAGHISVENLLSTLETGLRHVMCKPPTRKSKVNVIVSNEDFDSLPAVAPALWVPDYHRSLSERAVFLPTISHAIANVSGHSSAKSGLGIKAWQLSHRYTHLGKETFSASVAPKTNEVQDALSASLWTEMAAGLNYTKTGKQSQPFHDSFESTHEVDAFQDTEDMLDEAQMECGSDGTCDESEFEDLLDVASDADDDDDHSSCNWSVGDIGDMCAPGSTEALEHRLPNRWNSEHPSRLDPDFSMVDNSPKLDESNPRGVAGLGDGGEGGCNGSHREISQQWDDSYLAHDSTTLQYLKMEGEGFEAEDMLLWDVGVVGAESSSEQSRAERDWTCD